jgi:hypothetical protein
MPASMTLKTRLLAGIVVGLSLAISAYLGFLFKNPNIANLFVFTLFLCDLFFSIEVLFYDEQFRLNTKQTLGGIVMEVFIIMTILIGFLIHSEKIRF